MGAYPGVGATVVALLNKPTHIIQCVQFVWIAVLLAPLVHMTSEMHLVNNNLVRGKLLGSFCQILSFFNVFL
jgi:hypothetical protein